VGKAGGPKLVKLRYGEPYCEACRDRLSPGMLVAWWRVRGRNGRWRKAVFCAACHGDRVRMVKGRRRARTGARRYEQPAAG
jgi:hypothetical protein